jgi:hypothetical protein
MAGGARIAGDSLTASLEPVPLSQGTLPQPARHMLDTGATEPYNARITQTLRSFFDWPQGFSIGGAGTRWRPETQKRGSMPLQRRTAQKDGGSLSPAHASILRTATAQRVRWGLTGLATIFLMVLIAAAGVKPAQSLAPRGAPGEPLAVLGVAPGAGPTAFRPAHAPEPTVRPTRT